jgi:1,2-diacylglycerol 3-alpha-glucosyltransferase
MRILKISDVFFPRVNGVSTSIETFRRDLTALGHEVVLVAPTYASTGAQPTVDPDRSVRLLLEAMAQGVPVVAIPGR